MPNVTESTLAFLRKEEGFRPYTYRNHPKEPWTFGYGATWYFGPNNTQIWVKEGQTITQAAAEKLLLAQARYFGAGVVSAVGNALSQSQFDGLTSFAFNFGVGGFRSSRVAAAIKKNPKDLNTIRAAWVSYENPERRKREFNLYAAGSSTSSLTSPPVLLTTIATAASVWYLWQRSRNKV
jgi:GH24 family phage-related lysozyme (muramidase)